MKEKLFTFHLYFFSTCLLQHSLPSPSFSSYLFFYTVTLGLCGKDIGMMLFQMHAHDVMLMAFLMSINKGPGTNAMMQAAGSMITTWY